MYTLLCNRRKPTVSLHYSNRKFSVVSGRLGKFSEPAGKAGEVAIVFISGPEGGVKVWTINSRVFENLEPWMAWLGFQRRAYFFFILLRCIRVLVVMLHYKAKVSMI